VYCIRILYEHVYCVQSADCGIGVEGKEGRQASLAADFSISQFHHLRRLLFVHGRKAYKGSAVLAQFVIHRGILITTMQVIYSALFYFAAVGIFPSILLVGYATIFTMFPVFSLVLDEDVSPSLAMRFPELYKWLTRGREFSYKQFFLWSTISIFQGSVLMFGTLLLFEYEVYHIVAIAFTAVIFTELVMVLVVMKTWHWMTLVAELLSIACYLIAMLIFPDYFDHHYIITLLFIAKVAFLTLLSCIPLVLITFVVDRLCPSYGKKLEHVN
jgi:phospholipid-translocating ATPase